VTDNDILDRRADESRDHARDVLGQGAQQDLVRMLVPAINEAIDNGAIGSRERPLSPYCRVKSRSTRWARNAVRRIGQADRTTIQRNHQLAARRP
jgi:hypothetical protein